MPFEKAQSTQAYLKMGLMGFAGSGKSYTATSIAIGLHGMLDPKPPVYYLDTETGLHFLLPRFKEAGIEVQSDNTRAFKDLVPAVHEAAKHNGILVIDSITHFWRDLTESYCRAKKRNRLVFADWSWLKQEWGAFTDQFLNSPCHILMCGRAGFEYDFFEDDSGKKELEKTGVKMKVEGETGYEPSLLVYLERKQDIGPHDEVTAWRQATVLKDRGHVLDGKIFRNPTFEAFLPHLHAINIGGNHVGVSDVNSEDIIPPDDPKWAIERKQKEIILDEIKELLLKHYPSRKQNDVKAKGDKLEKFFRSRSWERIQTYSREELQDGYDNLLLDLDGAAPMLGAAPGQSDDTPF